LNGELKRGGASLIQHIPPPFIREGIKRMGYPTKPKGVIQQGAKRGEAPLKTIPLPLIKGKGIKGMGLPYKS